MGAFDNLINNTSGGAPSAGVGSYMNQVYLGSETKVLQGRGEKIKKKTDRILSIQEAQALYLTDPKVRNEWLAILSKKGLSTDKIKARALWDTAVAGASDWFSTSNGTQKVTPQQYLNWYVSSSQKKANVPSRSIYQYTPEQLGAKIDEVAQNILGRKITDADKSAKWYKNLNSTLNEMVQQGTVTTTQQVRNPKTGQIENVTVQKPEVSAEGISQKITGALQTADPEALARKQRIDFTKFLFSQGGQQR